MQLNILLSFKQVQQEGLQETYRQRQTVHGYLRMLLALPFIPARAIPTTFSELEGRANTDQLRAVVRYMRQSWIENPMFPVESWCVFGQSVRTNNDVEGNLNLYVDLYTFISTAFASRHISVIVAPLVRN